MSVNTTSPVTLFGGTWEQIKDKFLLSAGDTYNAGDTGGESTHQLTVQEMPSHSHNLVSVNSVSSTMSPQRVTLGKTSVSETVDLWAGYVGGNTAHNNMPPYLVVYVWKRTA